MALESKLYSALSTSATLAGLVGDGIYPIKAPQGTSYPIVVYKRAYGDRFFNTTGYSSLENAHVELIVYATAVVARRLTGDAAINALSSSTDFAALVIASPIDEFDNEVGIYKRTFDVSVWNRE